MNTIKFKVHTWRNCGGTFGAYIHPVIDGTQLDPTHHRINLYPSRRAARDGAFNIVRQLRAQRLFVVDVTTQDINKGEGRNCYHCAISRAMLRVLPQLGFDTVAHQVWVSPYAFFADTGIEIHKGWANPILHLPTNRFPDQLIEWAMNFDEWYDSLGRTLKEWREETGAERDDYPVNPWPVKFLLNLDDFQPVSHS
jgi:hypothetical protein